MGAWNLPFFRCGLLRITAFNLKTFELVLLSRNLSQEFCLASKGVNFYSELVECSAHINSFTCMSSCYNRLGVLCTYSGWRRNAPDCFGSTEALPQAGSEF